MIYISGPITGTSDYMERFANAEKMLCGIGCVPVNPAKVSAEFDTGVHIELPHGWYGKIESKSGLNMKYDVVSCGGTIDEGNTGSIAVKLYNLSSEYYFVDAGDKIAQLVIMPYLAPELEVVEALTETDRGNNGFGSTGR